VQVAHSDTMTSFLYLLGGTHWGLERAAVS
jgi:hypothetical protein